MINHYAPLTPSEFDAHFLGRKEILRVSGFGAQSGFGLSVLEQRGFFRSGAPLEELADPAAPPLLTWPFLDFVDGLELRQRTILELGAGTSTRWLAARFSKVRSFETDPDWHRAVAGVVGPGVDLSLVPLDALETATIDYRGEDWLLVDFAGKRTKFLQRFFEGAGAAASVRPSAIVLDNADWFRRGAAILAAQGYREIPFHGFKASQSWVSCTSLFIDAQRFDFTQKQPFFQPPFSRQRDNRWDSVD